MVVLNQYTVKKMFDIKPTSKILFNIFSNIKLVLFTKQVLSLSGHYVQYLQLPTFPFSSYLFVFPRRWCFVHPFCISFMNVWYMHLKQHITYYFNRPCWDACSSTGTRWSRFDFLLVLFHFFIVRYTLNTAIYHL